MLRNLRAANKLERKEKQKKLQRLQDDKAQLSVFLTYNLLTIHFAARI